MRYVIRFNVSIVRVNCQLMNCSIYIYTIRLCLIDMKRNKKKNKFYIPDSSMQCFH